MSGTEVRERRLVLVVGAVVFVDTLFYAVISPLLPHLVRELHMTKLSAGLMTASYPVGTLVGSIPGGVLAVRAGPKRAVFTGLSLLALSTVAFAVLASAAALDAARVVEGLGGACTWAGGFAWIAAETAVERRGRLMGQAIAAATGGALFGPALGTLADAVGRAPAFGIVVVAALVLMIETARLPTRHVAEHQGVAELLVLLRGRGVPIAMWLVMLPAVAAGAISVLAPLRLHRFGASAGVIGLAFVLAAAIETAITPAVGTLSDRRGRFAPMRIGLIFMGVLLACFTVPTARFGLVVLVIGLGASLGAFWAPATARLSDLADRYGLHNALAGALVNVAWAAGQTIGAGGGGALAKLTSDAVPMMLSAALCLLTLAHLARRRVPTHA